MEECEGEEAMLTLDQLHPLEQSLNTQVEAIGEEEECGILCGTCNGRGWLLCDFCKGKKNNVKAENNRIYRRCPTCKAAGYVLCSECKVYKCITFPDYSDGRTDLSTLSLFNMPNRKSKTCAFDLLLLELDLRSGTVDDNPPKYLPCPLSPLECPNLPNFPIDRSLSSLFHRRNSQF